MWVHYICLLIVIAVGLIALTFNIAVSSIDYLKDLTNAIERLTSWRDATFYTFIIMDVLYLILLLFGK